MDILKIILAGAAVLAYTSVAMAQQIPVQENRIDLVRPDAPELAAYGDTRIGVRTIEATNPDQIDVVNVTGEADMPRYDRPLTLEVWYPAADDAEPSDDAAYQVFLRDGKTEADIHGKAIRDAEPADLDAPLPVVVISHGYPGNRYLLLHLAENLASKGYVAVSVDHTDSTYNDQAMFGSTLVNRPLDQIFALNEIALMNEDETSFLHGLADASNAGLLGYSMGGYGAVITAGGGVTQASTELSWGAPAGTLEIHLAGSETHEELIDERFKAIVAIAPWGMERGFWDAEGLAGVRKPIFFIAGSDDDVSGYENGVKAIYEGSVNAERYLLTFDNANHNAAAPMPAPAESWKPVETLDFVPFDHYADAVWDTVRMNNITQHFVTAFFGVHLKGNEEMAGYLDLVENSNDGVHALEEDGTQKPEHTYWRGFANRTAKGLSLSSAAP
ncbi:alpha/beta hydrolase family protein [Oricola cellulosilytica]|uniref:Dienelactone hydrolase n=1 Tax=Oricola cellulosilytica TaxID=1429082 RepID=A0A4R0PHG2_9HYPH|nr:dienelactone hydrolase [Oricola cellulosilytica]TCD16448.1 dienelactone hydrolase [Oricola cellulosilytica]